MLVYEGIHGRYDIPRFLNEANLKGIGVEIGTHLGEYAEHLLCKWQGTLFCVDPWENAIDYESQIHLLWGGSDRVKHRHEAEDRLRPYTKANRCVIMPVNSEEALQSFDDNSLDFVYIDGNHEYKHILNDLNWWYPKLHKGGFLFGHDIICPGETYGWAAHIQPAVMRFCNIHSLDIALIPEGHLPWSFAIRKP